MTTATSFSFTGMTGSPSSHESFEVEMLVCFCIISYICKRQPIENMTNVFSKGYISHKFLNIKERDRFSL